MSAERGPKGQENWKDLAWKVTKGLAMIAIALVTGNWLVGKAKGI